MAKLVFRVFCVFGIFTLSRDLQLPSLVVGLAKVLLRVLLQVLRHKLLPQKLTNCDIKKWKWSVHFDQAWPYGLGVEKCIWNASRRWIFSTLNGRWIVDSRIYFFQTCDLKTKEANPSKPVFWCFDACFHRKFANVFRKKSFPDFSFHLCLFLLLRMSRITMLLTRPQRRRITPTAIRKTWLRKTMWTLLLLKMQEIRKENVKPAQPSEKGNTGDWWDWAQSYEKYLHLTLHLLFLL